MITMTEIEKIIREKLFEMQDEGYRDFHSRLMPTVDKDSIIGVRVPRLRKFAKELYKSVTIVSSSSLVADVYSTAIFVKGDKLKSDFLLNYPETEVIFN